MSTDSENSRLNLKEDYFNCIKKIKFFLCLDWTKQNNSSQTIGEQRYSRNKEQTAGAVLRRKIYLKLGRVSSREDLDWSSGSLERRRPRENWYTRTILFVPGPRVGNPARTDDFRRVAIDPGRKCNVRKAGAAAEKHRRRTGGLRARPWPKPSAIRRFRGLARGGAEPLSLSLSFSLSRRESISRFPSDIAPPAKLKSEMYFPRAKIAPRQRSQAASRKYSLIRDALAGAHFPVIPAIAFFLYFFFFFWKFR